MKKASLLILVSMILLLAFSSCTLVFKDKLPEPEEVLHSHVYGDVWESDALYHFKGCECGEKSNYTYHSDENGDRLCDACSYELPAQLATLLVTVEATKEDGTPFFGTSLTVKEGENAVFEIMVGVEYTLTVGDGVTVLSTVVESGAKTYTFAVENVTSDLTVSILATLCDHAWVDATCTTAKVCELCTLVDGEPNGHDWLDADCVTAKTCATCGETDGEPDGHTPGIPAGCLDPQICETCGDILVDALGHSGEVVPGYEATCTASGLTDGSVCSLCGLTLVEQETIAPLGHTAGEWIVDLDPTCTNDGAKHKECLTCGATVRTELIPALGHNAGEWIVDLDPTCTNDGAKHKECLTCGATVRTEPIPALGHTDTVLDAKAPTCTETGLTEGLYCAVCETTLVYQQTVDPLGHGDENRDFKCDNACGTLLIPEADSTLTIAEAIALGSLFKNDDGGKYTDGKYYVTGTIAAIVNATYGQMTLIDSDGREFGPYNTYSADGSVRYDSLDVKPIKGDTVTIYGQIGAHYNTVQMNSGARITAHVPHTCEYRDPTCQAPATCIHCDGTVGETVDHVYSDGICTFCGFELCVETVEKTISFASTSNRTTFNSNQQVWVQNGITFTNDKGASTSNVANYSNPVRCYKSSKVTVAYSGMFKIVFTCSSSSYASDFKSSIPSSDGVTVTISGSVVTVEFATARDSFVVEKLAAQVRFSGIAVYSTEKVHTPLDEVVENSVAPGCESDGSYDSVIYCSVCGLELSRDTVTVEALGHSEQTLPALDATCTESGLTKGVECTRCGVTLTEQTVIGALGHTASDFVVENSVVSDCANGGSYDKVVYCSVCGDELSRENVSIDALGHTPADAVHENEIPADCVNAGSYDRVVYCKVCGDELSRDAVTVDPSHEGGEPVVENSVDADCENDGGYDVVVYCTVCGEEVSRKSMTVVSPGHVKGDAVAENKVDATCESAGSYDNVVYCKTCGAELVRESFTVDPLGHTELPVEEKAATCTASGLTAGVICANNCGLIFSGRDTIDALGHVDANSDFKCERCAIKMLPADGSTLAIKDALAIAKLMGNTYTTQKYYVTGEIVSIENTTYGNVTIVDENGDELYLYGLYSEDGENKYDSLDYKPVVGDVITVYTVLGCYNGAPQGKSAWLSEIIVHTHDYTPKVTAPTCTAEGYTTYTCSICEGHYVAETTEALGHTVTSGTCERCGADVGGNIPEYHTYKADFNTLSANQSYGNRTTTSGWKATNCAVMQGGNKNSNPTFQVFGDASVRAFTLNGKTSAKGTITSPTLSGGLSKITFNYTNCFSESKGVDITVNVKQGGKVVATYRVDNNSVNSLTPYYAEWILTTPIVGEFTIEILNNSPSNSTSNKDRVSIWNLEWTDNPTA